MNKGDILLSPKYQFPNGDVRLKFHILLSDPTKTNTYVLVITTSQKKPWREDTRGCKPDSAGEGYYVFKNKDDWFNADTTWIPFESIVVLTPEDVRLEIVKNNFQKRASLSAQNLAAVINCIKSSPYTGGFLVDLIK